MEPGVYRLINREGDAESPIVYFDGKRWWLPGWECGMELSDANGNFSLCKANVGELIWIDNERKEATG